MFGLIKNQVSKSLKIIHSHFLSRVKLSGLFTHISPKYKIASHATQKKKGIVIDMLKGFNRGQFFSTQSVGTTIRGACGKLFILVLLTSCQKVEFQNFFRTLGSSEPRVTLGAASPNEVGGLGRSTDFSVTYKGANSVNLTSADVVLTGDTADCAVNILDGTTQTPTLRLSNCSSAPGQVTVQIQEGTAQDFAGNLALASNTQSVDVKTREPFVVVYRISSDNMDLELPLKPGFSYNFEVDWGDDTSVGKVTSPEDPDKNHTYAATGDYTVTIRGLMEAYGSEDIYGDDLPYKYQILSVPNLGDMGWKDLSHAFYDAENLTTVQGGNTSNVIDMSGMFYGAREAEPITTTNMSTGVWDTSKVTDMSNMFGRTSKANPDTSGWVTSKVTNMAGMFVDALEAEPITTTNMSTGVWDTSKVTDMSGMFYNTSKANPDTNGWVTSNVTSMYYMFGETKKANPDTSGWVTSSVTNMSWMFYGALEAEPVTTTDMSTGVWDTSKVTDMSYMFGETKKANPDTSGWVTSSVTNMSGMFYGAREAEPITTTNMSTGVWDTSKVTDMSYMFNGSSKANPDTSGWVTSNVTSMYKMFEYALEAEPITTTNMSTGVWDTSKITDMSGMFYNATKANPDTSGWVTSNVTNMSYMFYSALEAEPVTTTDMSTGVWDTSKITDMSGMFYNATKANPDTSGWVTSSVTNMSGMFEGASRANPDTSGWDLGSILFKWSFAGNSSGLGFFFDSNYTNLTIVNYSNFLINLANTQAESCAVYYVRPNEVCRLNVGGVKYDSSAQSARDALIDKGWNIVDGGY